MTVTGIFPIAPSNALPITSESVVQVRKRSIASRPIGRISCGSRIATSAATNGKQAATSSGDGTRSPVPHPPRETAHDRRHVHPGAEGAFVHPEPTEPAEERAARGPGERVAHHLLAWPGGLPDQDDLGPGGRSDHRWPEDGRAARAGTNRENVRRIGRAIDRIPRPER